MSSTKHSSVSAKVAINEAAAGVAYTVKAQLGSVSLPLCTRAGLDQRRTAIIKMRRWCTNISARVPPFHPLTGRAGPGHMELPGLRWELSRNCWAVKRNYTMDHKKYTMENGRACVHCAQRGYKSHWCLLCVLRSVMPWRVSGEVAPPSWRCHPDLVSAALQILGGDDRFCWEPLPIQPFTSEAGLVANQDEDTLNLIS